MNTINLSVRIISEIFWKKIFNEDELVTSSIKTKLFDDLISLEKLRDQADYNTGSISMAQAYTLYLFLKYFKPEKIIEVGTFIGRSTLSMANAIDTYSTNGVIHTCDMSNNILLPWTGKTSITQYPKTKSLEMIKKLKDEFDLIFLDGRISLEEVGLLENLISKQTIIILDDFEGMEKGVINLTKLRRLHKLNDHFQINPPTEKLLKSYNFFRTHSLMGALVPLSLFKFTNQ
jgi:predicted O-methyltransferase YrrM